MSGRAATIEGVLALSPDRTGVEAARFTGNRIIVSIFLLLSLFVIWLAWTPGDVTSIDPTLGVALMLGGFALLVLMARIFNRRAMQSKRFERVDHAVRGFNRRMSAARMAIPAWFAASVFVFGWGSVAHRLLGPAGRDWLEFPGVVVGLLPPLLAWVGLWWSQFDIDRALREQNLLVRFDRDMPVFAPPSFGSYVLNHLRTQLLFTLLPLLAILLLDDVWALSIRQLAKTSLGRGHNLWPLPDSLALPMHLASSAAVLLVSPLLIRHILPTQKLADSPLRTHLETLCDRTGLQCRDILLWRTQNNMGNALVMGVFAPLRFVLLSDLLLGTLTDIQIEAVFAHELGHIRHRHLVWFLGYFISMLMLLTALGERVDQSFGRHLPQGQWVDLTSGLLTGAIILIGFGMLSRRFERQADVFAARLIEQSKLVPSASGEAGSPVGSFVFASALEQIALVNNISIVAPNWTHGSIASRMRFIRQFGRDPATAAAFDRRSRRLRVGLLGGLVAGAAATGWTLLR